MCAARSPSMAMLADRRLPRLADEGNRASSFFVHSPSTAPACVYRSPVLVVACFAHRHGPTFTGAHNLTAAPLLCVLTWLVGRAQTTGHPRPLEMQLQGAERRGSIRGMSCIE